jgi:hypothetical protein
MVSPLIKHGRFQPRTQATVRRYYLKKGKQRRNGNTSGDMEAQPLAGLSSVD